LTLPITACHYCEFVSANEYRRIATYWREQSGRIKGPALLWRKCVSITQPQQNESNVLLQKQLFLSVIEK